MNDALLLHHAKTYLQIRSRGAIWVQGFNGKWHSDYNQPTKQFLMRFDVHVQEYIMSVVRRLVPSAARKITVEEIVCAPTH